MKAEDKVQILKFLIMLINSFFVILGISLFGCSAWILFDKSSFISVLSSDENVKVVAGGLFVIGLVVVGVSMLGCVGVWIENRCFIVFYMGFLIVIVLGQVFVTFLLLLKKNQIQRILAQSVDDIISNYGVNESQTAWSLLDSVQKSAECCGRTHPSDWQTNTLIQTHNMSEIYPCSCFNGTCPQVLAKEKYTFGNGSQIYTMGCEEKLNHWFQQNVYVIVGMDFGLIIIQILQFALGVHIYRTIGTKMEERHSRNLLSAEQTLATDPVVQHSDEENHQPDNRTLEQQLQMPCDQEAQEYARQSSGQYQNQHYKVQSDLEANSHIYKEKRNNAYDQGDTGQSYGQYEDQRYQHNDDIDYPQSSNDLYNERYIQNYDSRNNNY
ncbi:CD82 antigen [Brachyhypopomus gauderio]|uniref:CD82 antigen n=1 Tax=Brachyhypopomus gauderio TaxID=698409 RepID=UPI00404258F7